MEVERDLDPVPDAAALSVLKRIVLNRIAELEMDRAREAGISTCSFPTAAMGGSPKLAECPSAIAPAKNA